MRRDVDGRGFMETSGVHFTPDGRRPFYFAGANTYYLIYKSRYMVDALFDSAQGIGLKSFGAHAAQMAAKA